MLIFRVDHNLNQLERNLKGLVSDQLPFATAKALTKTAQAGKAEVTAEFQRRFDRPTRTTLNSLRVKPATKRDLTAMVFVKDKPLGGKNSSSMAQILGHQFTGGGRIEKAMEQELRRGGYLSSDEFIVPGASAKLDRYGNMDRGQLQKILSAIGVQRAGSTDTKKRKAKLSGRSRAGEIFWSFGPGSYGPGAFTRRNQFDFETGSFKGRRQNLPKGAWVRFQFAFGSAVEPLLLAVRAPKYSRRIDMPRLIQTVIDRDFARIFSESYREAQATAR